MEIKNAKIESAMLGYEGHGILTIQITVDYGDGGCQGFGGYSLGGGKNSSGAALHKHLTGVLNAVGAKEWDELKGMHIRVKLEDGKLVAIGHILEDKWFNPNK